MAINPMQRRKDKLDQTLTGLGIAASVGSLATSVKDIMSKKAESTLDDEAKKKKTPYNDENIGNY